MIRVTVRLLATLKDLAGRDYITLNFESQVTLKDLLRRLSDVIEKRARNRLFKYGSMELQSDIIILVNDIEIGVLNGLETVLKDGDIVSILPTVHGG